MSFQTFTVLSSEAVSKFQFFVIPIDLIIFLWHSKVFIKFSLYISQIFTYYNLKKTSPEEEENKNLSSEIPYVQSDKIFSLDPDLKTFNIFPFSMFHIIISLVEELITFLLFSEMLMYKIFEANF